MKHSVRLALSGIALLLASCLDYKEELWINANGSGKIHATISINSELGAPAGTAPAQPDKIEAQLKELFAATDGATVENYQSYTQGSKRIWEFTISFRDIRQLKPALATGKDSIGAVFGEFEIEKTPDGRLEVRRIVSLSDSGATPSQDSRSSEEGQAPESDPGKALGKAMGGLLVNAMFANYHLDYVTHFPTEVIGANSPAIDRENRTVTWRFPLSEASQGPVTMTAQIERPGTWMYWALALLLIVVTAGIVIPALRKKSDG